MGVTHLQNYGARLDDLKRENKKAWAEKRVGKWSSTLNIAVWV